MCTGLCIILSAYTLQPVKSLQWHWECWSLVYLLMRYSFFERLLKSRTHVDLTLTLQRRLTLTLCLSPDIYFYPLTTVSGGSRCYRRVGRQTRRLPFLSLHSRAAISTLLWTSSVSSIPPSGRVLPARNRGTSFSTIWWASSAPLNANRSNRWPCRWRAARSGRCSGS